MNVRHARPYMQISRVGVVPTFRQAVELILDMSPELRSPGMVRFTDLKQYSRGNDP